MPTIFICFGFVFKFFSDDHEPVHVHVVKDGHEAKFNVMQEVREVYNRGFKRHEMLIIRGLVEENAEIIEGKWKEFFK